MIRSAFVWLLLSCCAQAQDMSGLISNGLNSIRSSFGLPAVSRDVRLDSAAQSQADWMCSLDRMDHLRDSPKSFEEFKSCDHHPANRVVKSGYFAFDELFSVGYTPSGAEVHPRPAANTNVGEVIAAGHGGDLELRRPDLILNGWMNSPGHRHTILTHHFKDFGVGVAHRPGAIYFCVVFATRER